MARRTQASLVSSTRTRFNPLSRLSAHLHGSALDRRLAEGADPAEDPLLGQRAAQLTSKHSRQEISRWIESVVESAEDPDPLPRAVVPLQRDAILESRDQLLSLARELAALEEPANPRGVARARQLLTDGDSPLYGCPGVVCDRDGAELDRAVRHVRASLAFE
jgi:hypothetical protein